MGETFRFLCFGDNHGDSETLRRVAQDTEGETFDYVVHVGDFTNMYFEGYPTAQEQLDEMVPLLEELADRGDEFVYVFGNRDSKHRDGLSTSDIPVGTHVPEEGIVEVGKLAFSQRFPPEVADNPMVRVTHWWNQAATPPQFDGLLSLSGHTHNGRHVGNIIDTGFLHRPGSHQGTSKLDGGYFVVDVSSDGEVNAEFRSVGALEARSCPRHKLLGETYVVPEFWNKSCSYCYDEGEYIKELRRVVIAEAGDTTVTEATLDAVEDSFPRTFRDWERAAVVDGDEDSTEQTGLDTF